LAEENQVGLSDCHFLFKRKPCSDQQICTKAVQKLGFAYFELVKLASGNKTFT
jgi:hypothetical protein